MKLISHSIQTSQDPRIQAEGKNTITRQRSEIIFVSENGFGIRAGSEWVIGILC